VPDTKTLGDVQQEHADAKAAVSSAPVTVDPEVTKVTDKAKQLGKDATDAGAKIDAAVKEFKAIVEDVKTYAGDAETVGKALQDLDWIPGIGQGLQAVGGVLIGAGKAVTAIANLVEDDAAPILKALSEAANVLSEVGNDIGKFANLLIDADEEWKKAGTAFEDAAKAAEAELEKVAKSVEEVAEGVVEEVEHIARVVADEVVSAWNTVLSWFGDSHKNHAQKAQALTEHAKAQTEHLAGHGKKLVDAAATASSLLPAAA
jgi:uncharacterized protein YukE